MPLDAGHALVKPKGTRTHHHARIPPFVPLVKGDRVGTGPRGLQGARYVVHVCLEGCYVCENVVEGSVEPCFEEFFGEYCEGCASMTDVCWYSMRVP